MSLKSGDTMTKTLQRDGSYNVIIDMKNRDYDDRRVVANAKDPDAFYTRIRYSYDNPPVRDLDSERELLVMQKNSIESEITKVDTLITERDAEIVPKEL